MSSPGLSRRVSANERRDRQAKSFRRGHVDRQEKYREHVSPGRKLHGKNFYRPDLAEYRREGTGAACGTEVRLRVSCRQSRTSRTLRVPVIGPLISPLHKNFAEGRRYLFAIERIAFGNPAAGKQRVDRLVVLHRNRQDHFPGGQSLAVGLLPASFSRTRYGLAVAGARVFAGSDIIPARMV
jgi:hypothetical protein